MKKGTTHQLKVEAQPQKEPEGRAVLHVPFCSWTMFPNTTPPTCSNGRKKKSLQKISFKN
jgi:hypothetical protein